jgi:hypothetical protein
MLRALYRSLVLGATLAFVGIPAYADHDRSDWSRAYELTPLEHKRLRAKGLREKEIYFAANAAHRTGWSVDAIVDAIFRGQTTADAGYLYGLDVRALDQPKPEWTTPAWQEAVQRGDNFWTPPRTAGMGAPPRSR